MKITEKDSNTIKKYLGIESIITVKYNDTSRQTTPSPVTEVFVCRGPYSLGLCPRGCLRTAVRTVDNPGGICLSPDVQYIEIISKGNSINSVTEI